jgi:peptidoglycan-associated lipoprotein
MRKALMTAAVVMLALGTMTACATKKYVNTQVGDVNDKVNNLGKSVESTQERVGKAEGRITDVDRKADAAGQRADAAGKSAGDARLAADAAAAKAGEIDIASRKLIFEVTLTEDKAKFETGKADLSPEAKAELDALVKTIAADPKNIYLEIEGHTDSIGPADLNQKLGLQRAEAVKLYLYETHNIPLHKMSVISYGSTKPVAPNTTRDGRAQNRRVVIKVRS